MVVLSVSSLRQMRMRRAAISKQSFEALQPSGQSVLCHQHAARLAARLQQMGLWMFASVFLVVAQVFSSFSSLAFQADACTRDTLMSFWKLLVAELLCGSGVAAYLCVWSNC